ncbi:peptidase S14 [Mesorhizobium sp. WSM2239]|uniref:Peptidase S14 n=2 Tax=unclassified Mesorhizobium TaxID=325217 RepID=A0AAU8D4M2_9HYPH
MDAQISRTATSVPDCLLRPQIRMSGLLTDNKYLDFQSQLDNALNGEGPIGIELTTTGGDADLARRICMDINLFGERLGREFWFIGKTTVYSAGMTILAGFPRKRRFITRDCVLLIHERHLDMSLQLSGPLPSSLQQVQEMEHQLKTGIEIEREGFEMLCRDTGVGLDECIEKARTSWYVKADEALKLRLVEGVL